MKKLFLTLAFLVTLHAQPSTGTLYVTWTDTSTGESGYEVERTIDGGDSGWARIAVLPPDSSGCTDASAPWTRPMWYRIRAVSPTAQGPWAIAYWNPWAEMPAVLNVPGNPQISAK